MSFSSRKYKFILILADSIAGSEIWEHNKWSTQIEPLFRNLIEESPQATQTGIRVLEYGRKKESDTHLSELKLGRLKWDAKSHEKWTLDGKDERLFGHFESWTPIWTVCDKADTAPDIYISFWNEKILGREDNLNFDLFVTIAIADDLQFEYENTIVELSKQLNAKIAVCNIRSWGKGKPDTNRKWTFTDWILDTASFGIYKSKGSINIHDVPFESIEFEPYWEIIYKKDE